MEKITIRNKKLKIKKLLEFLILSFLMTYTFKRKLIFNNKSPRRIDRRSGTRNKKIILKSYQKIIKGEKINTKGGFASRSPPPIM